MHRTRSSLLHLAYLGAIGIKGLDGFIEMIAGLIIALVGSQQIYEFAVWATAPELSSNPESHTAHFVRHAAAGLVHAPGRFVIVYLLAHGIIKLALAINLLIEKDWVFPVASALLLGFIGYMSFRLTSHWSVWLLAFAIFDAFTLALVLNEWRGRVRR